MCSYRHIATILWRYKTQLCDTEYSDYKVVTLSLFENFVIPLLCEIQQQWRALNSYPFLLISWKKSSGESCRTNSPNASDPSSPEECPRLPKKSTLILRAYVRNSTSRPRLSGSIVRSAVSLSFSADGRSTSSGVTLMLSRMQTELKQDSFLFNV